MPSTVLDGGTIVKDPADSRVYAFDWDRHLASGVAIVSSTWALAGVSGDITTIPLTKDQPDILVGDRSTQIRVSAGGAGATWRLTNTVVTDETPAQTIERSVYVSVQDL